MKTIRMLGLMLGAGMAFAAAAVTSDSALVTTNEPHATLEMLTQGDIDKSHYPAFLVRIDGKPITTRNKREFYLAPGEHTLSFLVDWEKVKQYEPNNSLNTITPKFQAERTVKVNLLEGQTYKFGVIINNYEYANWTPYVSHPDMMSANSDSH